jgi:hypothetical protein
MVVPIIMLHTRIVLLFLLLFCLYYLTEISHYHHHVNGLLYYHPNKVFHFDGRRSTDWSPTTPSKQTVVVYPNFPWIDINFIQRQPRQSRHVLNAVFGSKVSSDNKFNNQKLTPLPSGLSPFDKAKSKTYDIQSVFRTIACTALQTAIITNNNNQNSNNKVYEIELPPLLSNGIDMSKNQFDDFDNVQELNANRDWCIQFIPKLLISLSNTKQQKYNVVWFILPDDKECEIAKNEYIINQRYKTSNNIQFTSIRAAYSAITSTNPSDNTSNNNNTYKKAWGTTLAETMNKLQGGDGILADSSTLDTLDATNVNRIQLICQPGNGGPVEDWINVEQLYYKSFDNNNNVPITIIMNGALDKVRDGYYPPIFFPALAKTIPFYQNQCEPILFIKPISDKGLYGWLYRVYPEPWQVILQLPKQQQLQQSVIRHPLSNDNNDNTNIIVEDIVVLVSNTRPSYNDAVNAMLKESLQRQQQQQQPQK